MHDQDVATCGCRGTGTGRGGVLRVWSKGSGGAVVELKSEG